MAVAAGGNTPPINDQNYAFQALGSPMRGYELDARNGNAYALANFELRVPVLSTRSCKRPIQSSFLRNLQLCGFTDAGSAWNGWTPNAENTSRNFNLTSVQTPVFYRSIRSRVEALRWVTAPVFALRSLDILPRVDAAWNIDGRTKPIWYVALGLDF